MTLLHFLTNITESTLPDLLQYQDEIRSCGEACRVSLPELQSDFKMIESRLNDIKAELRSYYPEGRQATPDDRFHEVMTPFIVSVEAEFAVTKVAMAEQDALYKECVKFYGEDPVNMKPDEFFGIFKTFTSSFEVSRFGLHIRLSYYSSTRLLLLTSCSLYMISMNLIESKR